MVYIYEENNEIKYIRNTKPQAKKIIELDKMIPIPNKDGYNSILKANFNTNQVWYELEETEQHKKESKIAELKQNLFNTDYQAIKYAEGQLAEEEYSDMKIQRQVWRDQINLLESELENIK